MVTVKKISWISESALEAVVTITDGCYELECFSQPCNLKLNEKLEDSIYCFNNKEIIKSYDNRYDVNKHDKTLAYNMTGCVEDKKNCLVKIGDILIKVEDGMIPGDIKDGDYINFYTQRLDLY